MRIIFWQFTFQKCEKPISVFTFQKCEKPISVCKKKKNVIQNVFHLLRQTFRIKTRIHQFFTEHAQQHSKYMEAKNDSVKANDAEYESLIKMTQKYQINKYICQAGVPGCDGNR